MIGRICNMEGIMKRIAYIMAFAMFLAVSCQIDDLQDKSIPESQTSRKVLTVGAAEDDGTRVGFDESNAFYWHKGDRIGVITTAGFKEMVIDDAYHGQASGVFTGDFEEEMGDYVVYPYGNHTLEGDVLTYLLPSSYTYSSIEDDANSFNPPMLGKIEGGNATLNHIASFFKISVSPVPAGGDDMKLILTADKRITGEFAVDLSADMPVLNTDDAEGNSVTVNFSNTVPGNSGTFYIPAPLGTYDSISVEVKDGETSLLTKTWTDQTVSRKTPKRGSALIDYVAEVDGTIYLNLQEALDAADNQTVFMVRDVVQDTPLIAAHGKTAVLDLNGKTLSGTALSAATSSLITVRSGADLTLKNGNVVFAATTPDTQWGGDGQPPYPGYANNTVRNEGSLTVENAFLENKTQKGGASYVVDNYSGAKLVVNDGGVLTQSGGDIAVRMFNGSAGAVDVTVNGGSLTGYRAVWIQLASSDAAVAPVMRLTVTGGTLNSADTVYNQAVYSYSYGNDMKNVLINVSGGTFNGDIALTGGANKTNLETVNISGGTFNGPWNIYSYGADEKAVEAIKITGGIFSYDPTDYLAAGYEAAETADGWIVRASVASD